MGVAPSGNWVEATETIILRIAGGKEQWKRGSPGTPWA
jgi:hypothetical protein